MRTGLGLGGAALGLPLRFLTALTLLPIAANSHVLGLRAHDYILHNDGEFKRRIGAGLMVVSILGLWILW